MLGSPKLQARKPGREINDQPGFCKNIPPNKNIVWRGKGGESCDLRVDIESGRQEQTNLEELRGDGISPGFVDNAGIDWVEAHLARQSRAHAGATGAGA